MQSPPRGRQSTVCAQALACSAVTFTRSERLQGSKPKHTCQTTPICASRNHHMREASPGEAPSM
eukprot:4956972-Pyramimonas_sp.AAC.1